MNFFKKFKYKDIVAAAAAVLVGTAALFAVNASTGNIEVPEKPVIMSDLSLSTADIIDAAETAEPADIIDAAETAEPERIVYDQTDSEYIPPETASSPDHDSETYEYDVSIKEKNKESDSSEKAGISERDSDSGNDSENNHAESDEDRSTDSDKPSEKESHENSDVSSDKIKNSSDSEINDRKSDSENKNQSEKSVDSDQSDEPLQTKYPPKKYEIKMKHYTQFAEMPTGCEIVSARTVLNYYGKDNISYNEMLSKIPMANLKVTKDGKLYGKTPFQAFIGDPHKSSGFGCYPPVIEEMIKNYGYDDLYTESVDGLPLDFIAKTYVTQDIPVMVWITIGLGDSALTGSWYTVDSNGKITDQKYRWHANEHCVVLMGYDEKYYYFCDPLSYSDVAKYDKALVEKRYKEIGSYALLIRKYEE